MFAFTIRRPDGRLERRRFVPFKVSQTGPQEWTATDPRSGRVIGRSYIGEAGLREQCGTHTEPA